VHLDLFEAAEPLCPRCLHQRGIRAPLVIALREEMRQGLLWHGILNCSDPGCWMEFPVLDGVPVITADPAATLKAQIWQAMRRDDLPPLLESLLGDAAGPGSEVDTTRQHLSLYAGSQYQDWTSTGVSSSASVIAAALAGMGGLPEGMALDIGCGTGRGGWEIAVASGRPTVACDLSLTFLRFAQRLRLEGRAAYPRRRIGTVFDRTEVTVPATHAGAQVDFWALDALALPFPGAVFALTALVNVVDCIAGPTEVLTEAARVTAPGGGAIVTTPYDWAPNVTPPAGWFGGHSQRAGHAGAGEPVLNATLARAGFEILREDPDIPWTLRLHSRSEMTYRLHMVLARRTA
jgi:SAM-dependent methyltransferase